MTGGLEYVADVPNNIVQKPKLKCSFLLTRMVHSRWLLLRPEQQASDVGLVSGLVSGQKAESSIPPRHPLVFTSKSLESFMVAPHLVRLCR